jgi:hypothetical protein
VVRGMPAFGPERTWLRSDLMKLAKLVKCSIGSACIGLKHLGIAFRT